MDFCWSTLGDGRPKRLDRAGIPIVYSAIFRKVGKRSGCKISHCERKDFTAPRFLRMLCFALAAYASRKPHFGDYALNGLAGKFLLTTARHRLRRRDCLCTGLP